MLAFAKAALLLLVFSLPFAKHGILIGALQATATEILWLIVMASIANALVTDAVRLRWNTSFLILAAYFAAMLGSVFIAGNLAGATSKLASQAYLLSLPVIVFALVDTRDDLRRLFMVWLAGTAVCAAIGVITLLLFAAGADTTAIDYALHGFGTLPPGAYPRLESTFSHPAMLCNYLTASLAILMICLHFRWISRVAGYSLFGAILVTAAFTITPGLGGIAAVLGVWLFVKARARSRPLAIAGAVIAVALALGFVAVSVVTPIRHSTAPFLIHLPGIELVPSVRLMAWIEASKSIADQPLLGAGFGTEPIAVDYVAPSGERHVLTDAHNVFLNIAMYNGLLGLFAVLALGVAVVRQMRPLRLDDANLLRIALGFAWLDVFFYQGLTGSYEDARHGWLLLGLFFAARRLDTTVADRAG